MINNKVYSKEKNVFFMQKSLKLALKALSLDEVSVGSIVVKEDKVIGEGFNQTLIRKSVISHAELIAINNASKVSGNHRLVNTVLFTTIEPCHMCAKAIVDARINHVVFGAKEPKSGALISIDNFFDKNFLNHKVTFEMGVLEKESSELMKVFFQSKRLNNN